MDRLIPAVNTLLTEDSELSNVVTAVRYWRAPRKPDSLIKPVVVFNVFDFSDRAGHHGGSVVPFIEIDIWGYDRNDGQVKVATLAANRVSNLLTTSRLVVPGGGSTRISQNTGWNNLNEQDPNTIRMQARFTTSYWPPSRIEKLTS